jgi:hypothetical protein
MHPKIDSGAKIVIFYPKTVVMMTMISVTSRSTLPWKIWCRETGFSKPSANNKSNRVISPDRNGSHSRSSSGSYSSYLRSNSSSNAISTRGLKRNLNKSSSNAISTGAVQTQSQQEQLKRNLNRSAQTRAPKQELAKHNNDCVSLDSEPPRTMEGSLESLRAICACSALPAPSRRRQSQQFGAEQGNNQATQSTPTKERLLRTNNTHGRAILKPTEAT